MATLDTGGTQLDSTGPVHTRTFLKGQRVILRTLIRGRDISSWTLTATLHWFEADLDDQGVIQDGTMKLDTTTVTPDADLPVITAADNQIANQGRADILIPGGMCTANVAPNATTVPVGVIVVKLDPGPTASSHFLRLNIGYRWSGE